MRIKQFWKANSPFMKNLWSVFFPHIFTKKIRFLGKFQGLSINLNEFKSGLIDQVFNQMLIKC